MGVSGSPATKIHLILASRTRIDGVGWFGRVRLYSCHRLYGIYAIENHCTCTYHILST